MAPLVPISAPILFLRGEAFGALGAARGGRAFGVNGYCAVSMMAALLIGSPAVSFVGEDIASISVDLG